MTFKTEQVGLGALQQARIGRAMRGMARRAALSLNGLVLKNKRPRLLGMALKADLVLGGGRAELFGEKAAVLVVAISTLHQSLLDTVPEWPVEVLLHIGVAAVAELRLLTNEQKLLLGCVMRRMTGNAAHVIGIVLGALEIGVLLAILVTGQAPFADCVRRLSLKGEDLALIAT